MVFYFLPKNLHTKSLLFTNFYLFPRWGSKPGSCLRQALCGPSWTQTKRNLPASAAEAAVVCRVGDAYISGFPSGSRLLFHLYYLTFTLSTRLSRATLALRRERRCSQDLLNVPIHKWQNLISQFNCKVAQKCSCLRGTERTNLIYFNALPGFGGGIHDRVCLRVRDKHFDLVQAVMWPNQLWLWGTGWRQDRI